MSFLYAVIAEGDHYTLLVNGVPYDNYPTIEEAIIALETLKEENHE